VVIVAGILLTAVGDELVIAHPTEELPDGELAAVVCGPALYLLAHVALRLRMTGTISGRRLAGAFACLAIGAIGTFASALIVAGLLFGVLVGVIVADRVSGARRTARGEPSPLERVEAAG
jgi:low temperature requirement protein LtrA